MFKHKSKFKKVSVLFLIFTITIFVGIFLYLSAPPSPRRVNFTFRSLCLGRLCNSVKAYKKANDVYPENLYDIYVAWQENEVAEDLFNKLFLRELEVITFKDPNELSEYIGCEFYIINEHNWFIIERGAKVKDYPYRLIINQDGVIFKLKEVRKIVDMHDWYIDEVNRKQMKN